MFHLPTLNHRTKPEPGFTLLEVIIAVVVVGILVAIAVPAYHHQQAVALGATVKADVGTTVISMSDEILDGLELSEVTPMVTGDNQVTVAGTWQNYTVRATNPDASPTCWEYVSATKVSREC